MATWVPDWREPSPTNVAFNHYCNLKRGFCAAGTTTPCLRPIPSPDKLVVRGFLVAPITRVLHARRVLNSNAVAVTKQDYSALRWAPEVWENLYKQAVVTLGVPASVVREPESADRLSPLFSRDTASRVLLPLDMVQIALRRTVVGDLYPRPNGRLSEGAIAWDFTAYAAWSQRQFDGPPPPQVLCEHDETVRKTMHNRRVFVAGDEENAFLGNGLRSLRPGDWICVLLGGKTPFLLRPSRPVEIVEDASDVREWEFVCECYVHGLMDGEAMDRTAAPHFDYKDFVLAGPCGSSARL